MRTDRTYRYAAFYLALIAFGWLSSCRLNDNKIRGQYGPGTDPNSDSSPGDLIPPAPVPESFSLSYGSTDTFYRKSMAITPLVPVLTGTATSLTIDPPLPPGLNLDTATGVISGTPSLEVAPTIYTITAHHADGRTVSSDIEFYVPFEFTTLASLGTLPDANPGDGLCSDSGGDCTIRSAVSEANALSIPSIIHIPAGTYNFPVSGELTVSSNITLMGADKATTIFDGQNQTRILSVADDAVLSISELTLQKGRLTAINESGAAVKAGLNSSLNFSDCRVINNTSNYDKGGAVLSAGSVNIEECLFDNNNTIGGFASGGAIAVVYQTGSLFSNSLVIKNSQLNNNTSSWDGGAVYSDYQGTISDSEFINNSSSGLQRGGAIFSKGLTLVYHSQFKANSAGKGGAIYLDGQFDFGPSNYLIENSYFDNNSSILSGGAILFDFFTRPFKIENSTFYGNHTTQAGSLGGAIYVFAAGSQAGERLINNCTFSGSSAPGGGATLLTDSNEITISNTIINDVPGSSNCMWNSGNGGAIVSGGYNIDSGNSCGLSGQGQVGDLESTDPLLDVAGPQLNGDTIPSILLSGGSPALNAVPAASCLTSTDQRGVARPQGGSCDIGAIEQ